MNGQFDGNAAFSGGGFMPSQATQSADPGQFTPAKNRDVQSLLPLTVKQIKDALEAATDEKAEFQIDGVDVHNVKMVGMMVGKTERVTDVAFALDDGSGRIDCHRWASDPFETKEMEILQDGMYIKVHGKLNAFQGKKQLNVYSCRPVTDYNEIAYHFADCIYVHCYNTRLQKMQNAGQVPGHMSNAQKMQDAGQVPGYVLNSAFNTPSNNYPVQYNTVELQGIPKLVLDCLQRPVCINLEQGFHRREIAQHLNIPEQQISEILEKLVSDGYAYSTVDEDHYRSVING